MNLDFAKGYKTHIGAYSMLIAMIVNLSLDTDIEKETVEQTLLSLFENVEVAIAASLAIYGIVMKVIRKYS